ncbi:MAG: peptidoglycan bridge formation glycyltransferase FemA/FemB family protein [Erysipelotrichaceae bacterium]|nr:peptidoglycan bridge formation glycyltransferase FemA/FemB family protein [Erysipelotrichaceae bacterium]
MKEFCILTEDEYTAFQMNSPLRGFLNSPEAIHLKQAGGWQTEYAGVKENGRIIAATALTMIPLMKIFRFCHAQSGFLMDYHDEDTLAFFTAKLKKHLAKQKVVYMLINPNIDHVERDIDGNEVEGGYDNSYVKEALERNGFEHRGFVRDYSAFTMISWIFTLDLRGKTEAQVLKEMDQQTRWSVNKTVKQGIQVRELKPEEIGKFIQMEERTAQRRGFEMREKDFYVKQLEAYGEHAKVLLAYLDLNEFRENLKKEKEQLDADMAEVNARLAETPNSKKFVKKQRVIQEALDLNEKKWKEADETEAEHGSLLEMAASFFIIYDNEIVYLYSAAEDEYRKYNAPYAIQLAIIRYALEHKIPRYNFYGISGNFSKDADDYGVYEFKKGFGGRVEQLIGEFILPVNRTVYRLYRTIKK